MDLMGSTKLTHYAGTLRAADIGKEVTVAGWVQRRRDLGGLIFIDLRDREGIVQLAFDETCDKEVFEKAFAARGEYVLMATGKVRERSSKNKDIPTGDIEIEVTALKVLAKSETPPFEITENCQTAELTRLKYRYLDLRRPDLQRNLMMRHKISKITRDYFDENGFIEIETPVLIRSTPEGARDFIVPSRIHKAVFTRYRNRRSCISNSPWSRGLTAIFNSRAVFATKTCARTVSRSLPRSTWKCRLWTLTMCSVWWRATSPACSARRSESNSRCRSNA
jgi:aspartyl/asparaginyl-tRNA synthetase